MPSRMPGNFYNNSAGVIFRARARTVRRNFCMTKFPNHCCFRKRLVLCSLYIFPALKQQDIAPGLCEKIIKQVFLLLSCIICHNLDTAVRIPLPQAAQDKVMPVQQLYDKIFHHGIRHGIPAAAVNLCRPAACFPKLHGEPVIGTADAVLTGAYDFLPGLCPAVTAAFVTFCFLCGQQLWQTGAPCIIQLPRPHLLRQLCIHIQKRIPAMPVPAKQTHKTGGLAVLQDTGPSVCKTFDCIDNCLFHFITL